MELTELEFYSSAGKIQLFAGHRKEPIIVADVGNMPPVEYFGFSSYDNSPAKYFYGCESDDAHPEGDLREQCRYAEAMENEYKQFYKIADMAGARTQGNMVNFPFYVRAARDVHVLLTTVPVANRESNEYEIGDRFFIPPYNIFQQTQSFINALNFQ